MKNSRKNISKTLYVAAGLVILSVLFAGLYFFVDHSELTLCWTLISAFGLVLAFGLTIAMLAFGGADALPPLFVMAILSLGITNGIGHIFFYLLGIETTFIWKIGIGIDFIFLVVFLIGGLFRLCGYVQEKKLDQVRLKKADSC